MGERSGPFWDGVEGRAPMPPAAATLGLEFGLYRPRRSSATLAGDDLGGQFRSSGRRRRFLAWPQRRFGGWL